MAIKRAHWHPGRVLTLEHQSQVLRDNPLGDPHLRKLSVWLPPQYDQGTSRNRGKRFPVLYSLAGFTGSGAAQINWQHFDESQPARAARLVHERRLAPCILVFPDCFTALGGNQYINSTGVGRYADYLTRELIPFVDAEFRTLASRDHRGCFGKSSGGYGAIIHGMKYPRYWGAVADHSGDAYFDFTYRPDWPAALDELAKHRRRLRKPGAIDVAAQEPNVADGTDDGRVRRFLQHMWKEENPSGDEVHCLMYLAMAATYDPDPTVANGFRLPFNLETGELIEARWRQWLKHDPINLVSRYQKGLKSLRGSYVDCGWRDQYRIHYGCRLLSKRMAAAGIKHRYEEFDGTHSGISHRMHVSWPFLLRALR